MYQIKREFSPFCPLYELKNQDVFVLPCSYIFQIEFEFLAGEELKFINGERRL